jgi:subtilisin
MFNRMQRIVWIVLAFVLMVSPAATAAPPARERFIVVFHDSVGMPAAVASELAQRAGGQVSFVYEHALKGFSIELPAPAAAVLTNDPRVAYVEVDQVMHTFSQEIPTGVKRIFADQNSNITIDGIDDLRIDVDVAVIDTGIDSNHPDLNVYRHVDCSGGSPLTGSCKAGGTDKNGHGTHVAGTIGALDNGIGVVGVAPGARLWGVKVLGDNGSGYTSWIIAGIDYVTKNAAEIEVANMSLGCECYSKAQDDAIARSVRAGVTYVVAAGNSNKDASTFSPANHPDVITVSALADFDGEPGGRVGEVTDRTVYCREDTDDTLANFSNFGSLIDIAAPGVCIKSTWPGGGYNIISGTSMASPHAAGAAALLAASGIYSPASIRTILQQKGNDGWNNEKYQPQEILLDVRDASVFNPATYPGSNSGGGDTDGGGDTGGSLTLSATARKQQGFKIAELSWSGNSGNVNIYSNGSQIAQNIGGTSYTHNTNEKGGGSATYKVCEASGDTTICSADVTVSW